jgi:hypothetical protein
MIAQDAPDFNPGRVTMQGVDTSPFRAGREMASGAPDFSPGMHEFGMSMMERGKKGTRKEGIYTLERNTEDGLA